MTREVVTVPPGATVAEALDEMRTHGIRHLPVVDDGRLVGVVTDRDLRLALEPDGSAPQSATVEDTMTSSPIVVASELPIESAAALLSENRIGCLPVVDEGEIVGILTRSDLLRSLVDLMVGREPSSRIELLAPDRPGELARVVRLIGIDYRINITGMVMPPSEGDRALVILHLEAEHVDDLLENLRRLGYECGSPALAARPT